MTPTDSKNLATYAANVPSLPAGSSFRVGLCILWLEAEHMPYAVTNQW